MPLYDSATCSRSPEAAMSPFSLAVPAVILAAGGAMPLYLQSDSSSADAWRAKSDATRGGWTAKCYATIAVPGIGNEFAAPYVNYQEACAQAIRTCARRYGFTALKIEIHW